MMFVIGLVMFVFCVISYLLYLDLKKWDTIAKLYRERKDENDDEQKDF